MSRQHSTQAVVSRTPWPNLETSATSSDGEAVLENGHREISLDRGPNTVGAATVVLSNEASRCHSRSPSHES